MFIVFNFFNSKILIPVAIIKVPRITWLVNLDLLKMPVSAKLHLSKSI